MSLNNGRPDVDLHGIVESAYEENNREHGESVSLLFCLEKRMGRLKSQDYWGLLKDVKYLNILKKFLSKDDAISVSESDEDFDDVYSLKEVGLVSMVKESSYGSFRCALESELYFQGKRGCSGPGIPYHGHKVNQCLRSELQKVVDYIEAC